MTREEVFAYAKRQYGTAPDYPWGDRSAVLRHRENGKWYGVLLELSRAKLGLPGEALADVLNVKCDPKLAGSFRTQEGFHPAYHMNKERWLTIRLDGSAPDDAIKSLLDLSWQATAPKRRPKKPPRSEGKIPLCSGEKRRRGG